MVAGAASVPCVQIPAPVGTARSTSYIYIFLGGNMAAMAEGDAKLPGSTEGSLDAHSTTASAQFLQT